MNQKDIDILIEKYLNGKTTPEEEKALALEVSRDDAPQEWKIIAEMLGELTVDEALYDKMMAERNKKPRIVKLWPWVAAACVAGLLLIVLTPTKPPQQGPHPPMGESSIACVSESSVKQDKVETRDGRPLVVSVENEQQGKPANNTKLNMGESQTMPDNGTPYVKPHYSEPIDGNLRYASITINDTLKNYQSPSRMEEFIMKMADYHRVKGERLPYSSSEDDSLTVSTAYVFNDTKELNLFSRLLQAACWYEDTTPGYLLNYSHQQFFFQLKDLRLGMQYLWIAERIRGKILLYSAHAPLDAEMSSDGFREYRNRLSNTSIKF